MVQKRSMSPKEASSMHEKKASAISHYIEMRVVGNNVTVGDDEEKELKAYFAKLSPRERADILYDKIMAHLIDKQADRARSKEAEEKGETFTPERPDPYFISEIKVLFSDPSVKQLFSSTYSDARVDAKRLRMSELGNLWRTIDQEILEKTNRFKQHERDIYLNQISGAGQVSSTRTKMEMLTNNVFSLEKQKTEIETLQGFSKVLENTDIVANFAYEKLKDYKRQLDSGFVWLPSRQVIHQKTVSAILNHRWPVLIGETGSGKSDQADAAALELTGYLPTEIECESTTGEIQLLGDIAIDSKTGGTYQKYGPLMRAFTGYDDERQEQPSVITGRIVRFDESGRLGPKAYSIIKEARQKHSGEDFHGRRVLPGAGAIWTSNPVGPRYPDRNSPDPAMRRELAEIHVDYPDMSPQNPELYEFSLVALMNEHNHITVAKEELAPAYERKDFPENQREVLEGGGVVVAKNEIVESIVDRRHGVLWRFCGAIKALQNSFVYGNSDVEKYPDILLRFKEDADGNIEVMTDGTGEPLTLSTSTVTLGELASWMKGFSERKQKKDVEFHVDTFTEWLNFKIKTYLEQADKADKQKLKAIFRYFGFLDQSVVFGSVGTKPLTPKEIGYLSPRVPRPVYVELPTIVDETNALASNKETKEIREYETREVVLEDSSRVLIKIREFMLENGVFDQETNKLTPLEVVVGKRFKVGDEFFIFSGVIEDEKSPYNGQPIAQFVNNEGLYKVVSLEELSFGIEAEFKDSIESAIHNIKKDLLEWWKDSVCEDECVLT